MLMLLVVNACTSDNENLNIKTESINYEELNLSLKENLTSLGKMIEFDEELSNEIDAFLETGDDKYFQKRHAKSSIKDKVTYNKDDLSEIYSDKQKEFLVDFYNELANSEDGNILDIVIDYKNELNNQDFSSEEYNQIEALLIALKQFILVLDGIIETGEDAVAKSSFSARGPDCGFWCCMRKKAGKAIGRGMVYGAIGGAIGGAKIGAAGGTVVLPGIGTATGAVGGAVFGAAGGAISGAIGGAIWTAVDCGGGKALKDFIDKEINK